MKNYYGAVESTPNTAIDSDKEIYTAGSCFGVSANNIANSSAEQEYVIFPSRKRR